MLKPVIVTFAAAASIAAAAPASGREQPQPAPQSIAVSHADLDLSTVRGARAFMQRVDQAVAKVCGVPANGGVDESRYEACRTTTMEWIRPQAERMIAQAVRPARADRQVWLAAR